MATEPSEVSDGLVSIPQDPTTVSPGDATFFKPPCVTPTGKIIKELGDMGHLTPDLGSEGSSRQEEEDEQNTTASLLKKKKRFIPSFENSFFSGCTPIKEEES